MLEKPVWNRYNEGSSSGAETPWSVAQPSERLRVEHYPITAHTNQAVSASQEEATMKAFIGKRDRRLILERQKYLCFYCGADMSELVPGKPATYPTIDHLEPRSVGGSNRQENYVAACRPCNARKKNRTLEQYREYLQQKEVHTAAANLLAEALTLTPEIASMTVEAAKAHLEKTAVRVLFHGEA